MEEEKENNKEIESTKDTNSHDSSWFKEPVEITKSKEEKERKLHARRCPYCKQEYQTKIGVDNWKNLFRKPTLDDVIVLVILILIGIAAFAYTTETKACRDVFNNASRLDEICTLRKNLLINYTGNGIGYVPIPNNITIINESTSEVNSSNDSGQNLSNYVPYTGYNYSSNVTNQTRNLTNVSR